MRRAHWLGVGAVALLGGAALLAWQRWAPQVRPPSVALPAPVPALQADIERHLHEDRAFRDDVVFLLAATVRGSLRPRRGWCAGTDGQPRRVAGAGWGQCGDRAGSSA